MERENGTFPARRAEDAGEESFRIWLEGEDGAEHEFELISTFYAEETTYAALHPTDGPEGEAILLTVREDGDGSPLFAPIGDDEEYENAGAIFEALFNGEAEAVELSGTEEPPEGSGTPETPESEEADHE